MTDFLNKWNLMLGDNSKIAYEDPGMSVPTAVWEMTYFIA